MTSDRGLRLYLILVRSRSIWMPVLAHASGDTVAALLFTELTMPECSS